MPPFCTDCGEELTFGHKCKKVMASADAAAKGSEVETPDASARVAESELAEKLLMIGARFEDWLGSSKDGTPWLMLRGEIEEGVDLARNFAATPDSGEGCSGGGGDGYWRSLVDGNDMPPENEWVLCAWDEGSATMFDPLDLAMGLHVDHEWRFIGPRPSEGPTHWMRIDRHIPNLDAATRAEGQKDSTRDVPEPGTGDPKPDDEWTPDFETVPNVCICGGPLSGTQELQLAAEAMVEALAGFCVEGNFIKHKQFVEINGAKARLAATLSSPEQEDK